MAYINGKEVLFGAQVTTTPVTVVQETGDSETFVMSQKATTEALAQIEIPDTKIKEIVATETDGKFASQEYVDNATASISEQVNESLSEHVNEYNEWLFNIEDRIGNLDTKIPSEHRIKEIATTEIKEHTLPHPNDIASVNTGAGFIPTLANDGTAKKYQVYTTAGAYTIPLRAEGGRLAVGTPTQDDSATPKKYVDDATAPIPEHARKIADNAKRIEQLEGTLLTFIEDNESAYEKDVPIGVGKHAIISSIGGKTEFLEVNPANWANVSTFGEVNDDGSVTFTVSEWTTLSFRTEVPKGIYYIKATNLPLSMHLITDVVQGNVSSGAWVRFSTDGAITFELINDSESVQGAFTSKFQISKVENVGDTVPFAPYSVAPVYLPYNLANPANAVGTNVSVKNGYVHFSDDTQAYVSWDEYLPHGIYYVRIISENAFRRFLTVGEKLDELTDTDFEAYITIPESGAKLNFYLAYEGGSSISGSCFMQIAKVSKEGEYVPQQIWEKGFNERVKFIHAPVTKVESYGANLFNPQWLIDYDAYAGGLELYGNGLKVSDVPETINISFVKFMELTGLKVGDSFTTQCKMKMADGKVPSDRHAISFDGTFDIIDTTPISITITEDMLKYQTLKVYAGGASTTNPAFITDIMVIRGDTIADYKPYSDEPIDTFDIPSAIQDYEGYGHYGFILDLEGKTVTYNSKTTDVSAYLSDYTYYKFIAVQGSGRVRFVNEHGLSVPSVISYVKTKE